jgi:crotonobetainyl-CoA:carnitine CoA-transferase CaiB-like acyl-CoA transferase
MFPLVGSRFTEQSLTGRVSPRSRCNRHSVCVPRGLFPGAGEDTSIVIAATNDMASRALCAVIRRDDLALGTATGRRAEEDRIEAAIADWTRTQAPGAAMTMLQAAGVARGFQELMLRDPHLLARGYRQSIGRPFLGAHPQPSTTFHEEGRPIGARHQGFASG